MDQYPSCSQSCDVQYVITFHVICGFSCALRHYATRHREESCLQDKLRGKTTPPHYKSTTFELFGGV